MLHVQHVGDEHRVLVRVAVVFLTPKSGRLDIECSRKLREGINNKKKNNFHTTPHTFERHGVSEAILRNLVY